LEAAQQGRLRLSELDDAVAAWMASFELGETDDFTENVEPPDVLPLKDLAMGIGRDYTGRRPPRGDSERLKAAIKLYGGWRWCTEAIRIPGRSKPTKCFVRIGGKYDTKKKKKKKK
jgi:hypothetical protein